MKLKKKDLNLLSGILMITGAVIIVLSRNYNNRHPDDTTNVSHYIAIFIILVAMILLAPWIKPEEKD